jgi:predicted transcriptional regulator
MNELEKSTIRIVAKVAPWLSPVPSAYFVARSSITHLDLPLPVAVIVAAIIETLGLATVHTALWAYDWNAHKRKSDPSAPVVLAVILGGVYIVATLLLVVFLEVWPFLATYAPAIFPALAIVGAVNLAVIAQQERREITVKKQKAERKARRRQSVSKTVTKTAISDGSLDRARKVRVSKKEQRLDAVVDYLASNPNAGPTEIGREVGVSRQTIYTYLEELEQRGRIGRDNGTVRVQ